MKRCLTERQRKIVNLAAELAERFAARAEIHDRDGTFPAKNFDELKAAGYMTLTVPEELGGLGGDLIEMTLAQERLAMGCGTTALVVSMHVSPVGQLAARWRRERRPQDERLLKDIVAGKAILATVPAEAGHSILMTSNTTARKVDGGFLVSGRKIFGTGTAIMTHLTTMARYDDPERGPHVMFFRLPRDAQGLVVEEGTWDTLGMRATLSNNILLENVFVPDEAIFHRYPVDHFDATLMQSTWGWSMPSFASVYLGMAAGGMERARLWVKERGFHERAYIQHLFVEMELLLESARAVMWRVCEEVMTGALLEQLTVQEAMARTVLAKHVATNNAVQIMDRVMQVVGGAGYRRGTPFERLYRDVRAGTIHPYNNVEAFDLFAKTIFDIEIAPAVPFPAAQPSTPASAHAESPAGQGAGERLPHPQAGGVR